MYEIILAATDGSDGARRAVERAIELASLFDADLHVLYIAATDQFSADKPTEAVDDIVNDLVASGRAVVSELKEEALASGVDSVQTSVERGVPAEAILDYAEDRDVKLVVMGTHGSGGFETVHLGSTATTVGRRIDVPLLLV